MAQGMSLSDFKKGNTFVTILIVAVFGVLLFLPDMIGLNTGVLDAGKEFSLELPKLQGDEEVAEEQQPIAVQQEVVEVQPEEPVVQVAEQVPVQEPATQHQENVGSPLQQVNYFIDQGGLRAKPEAGPEGARYSVNIDRATGDGRTDGPVITFDKLWSRESINVVRRLRADAQLIIQDLPENRAGSRVAIRNYMSALDSIVLNGDSDSIGMNAAQAASYLLDVDANVTRTLAAERAPRGVRVAWAKVSLKPLLGENAADQLKEQTPVFDPKVRIQSVWFSRPAGNYGEYLYDSQIQMGFISTAVGGSEINKLYLKQNGRTARILAPKREDQEDERFRLEAAGLDPTKGPMTVLMKDKYGETYKRVYNFNRPFPRSWWSYNQASNTYQLVPPSLKLKTGDPRLEAFFLHKAYKKDQRTSFFASTNNKVFTKF